jgi:hypothetical protein
MFYASTRGILYFYNKDDCTVFVINGNLRLNSVVLNSIANRDDILLDQQRDVVVTFWA